MTPMLEAQNISGLQKEQPLLLLEENLEQLSIGNEEEYGWEDELEELSRRLQEPVNLNAATKRQLEQFPFLTDIQIENLLAYVYIHGQMQTIYELQLVEEMDKRTIDLLLPFVCVRAVKAGRGYPALKSILKYGKHETLARLDVPFYIRKGYYNPQNEMFRRFRTKCSIFQNETYLRESFSLLINQIKKHRKNLLLRCFFIACLNEGGRCIPSQCHCKAVITAFYYAAEFVHGPSLRLYNIMSV